MDRGQVTVSISEGWIDLDGTSVALQSSLDILHFLQSVSHVGIGISECGADSKMEQEKMFRHRNVQADNPFCLNSFLT